MLFPRQAPRQRFMLIWLSFSLILSTLFGAIAQQYFHYQQHQNELAITHRFTEQLEHLYSVTRVIALIRAEDPDSILPARITRRVAGFHPELLLLSLRQGEDTLVLHNERVKEPTPWPSLTSTAAPAHIDPHLHEMRVQLSAPQQHPQLGQVLEVLQQLPRIPNGSNAAPVQIRMWLQSERMLERAGLNPARYQLVANDNDADVDLRPLHIHDRAQKQSWLWAWLSAAFAIFLILLGIPAERLVTRQQARMQRTLDAARSLSDQARTRAQLLGSFSHDLRTPLTRLRLRAEEHPETRAANLHDVGQIERFVNASLEYLRSEPSQEPMRALDLDSRVRDWVALGLPGLQTSLLRHQIAIHGRIDLPYVGREIDLMRCLQNLLANALRYGAPPISVHLFDDREAVRIQVRDHGPGIADAERERLLQPFQRGSSLTEREPGHMLDEDQHMGFGLGLAIAKELCEAHLGELRLRNAEGGGLIAEMWLPR